MDITQSLPQPYEFEWKGKRYSVSRVTQRIRSRLANFIKQKMIREAKANLSPEEYSEARNEILAGSVIDKPGVLMAALGSLEGQIEFVRIVLNDDQMSSDDVIDLLANGEKHINPILELLAEELREGKVQLAKDLLLG